MSHDFESISNNVFKENLWGGSDSRSGPGSNLQNTSEIRIRIPELLKKYNIKLLIDAPCGDFNWMKGISNNLEVLLDSFLGIDIVDEVIELNNKSFATDKIKFTRVDLTKDRLPEYDCVLCRDLFLHLPYKSILKVISNFKKSGIKYMLLSTYTNPRENFDVLNFYINGRALNMQNFPFYLPDPIEIINEKYEGQCGQYNDKSLALWELDRIRTLPISIAIILSFPYFYIKSAAKKIINA